VRLVHLPASERKRARLAVDIGGTFTDVASRTDDGTVRVAKVPTLVDDLAGGVLSGARALGVSIGDLEVFVNGTTVVLNTLLERKTPRIGLITTRGFRDVLEIMRTNRPDMYDLQQEKPKPLVPRRWRREITARMTHSGASLVDVDPEEVRTIGSAFAADGITSIAVCLLNSYANPEHERAVHAVLSEVLPEGSISLSSDLSREWGEFERTSTAVINSAAKPSLSRYLDDLEADLATEHFDGQLLIMQSNGGVMSASDARRRPVATLMSGPVGGVAAAGELIDTDGALRNVVTLDVGGTSADVAILDAGEPVTRGVGEIAGWPVMVPMVDIRSIGAGGGSIARVDAFGRLAVGPESAGAFPGPACYGRGGTLATVTDANLVLGRLDSEYFAGGDFVLDEAAARSVIEREVAQRYEMSADEAALGIVTVIDSTMARLLWEVMIASGYDPRDFALLAFGGAGPLHACSVARTIGVREVVVPPNPGTFSAYGMITADIRRDFERMVFGRNADADLTVAFAELERTVRGELESQHTGYARVDYRRFVELRYAGQRHPLLVEIETSDGEQSCDVDAVRAAFHDKHHRLYGFRRDSSPVEFLRIQVSAIGRVPRFESISERATARPAIAPTRRRQYLKDGSCVAPVFQRSTLVPGATLPGPCLVEEPTSTTFVPPDCACKIDLRSNLRISVPPLEVSER
jgi:N-methylhydantoinase A